MARGSKEWFFGAMYCYVVSGFSTAAVRKNKMSECSSEILRKCGWRRMAYTFILQKIGRCIRVLYIVLHKHIIVVGIKFVG